MEPVRLLAFAAATGRIGWVFLIDGDLMDWHVSRAASESPQNAAEYAASLIAELSPTVVVTEETKTAKHKGATACALIAAMAQVAENHDLLDVRVPRAHRYRSKYEEADALIERYPDLAPWRIVRRFFDTEPRGTVIFEALAFAETVRGVPV